VTVAIVHDYLTQRGGAERVVLSMLKAFPGAPVYTSLYDSNVTFPEFREHDVRPLPLDRSRVLRRNHRAALPLLATAFGRLRIKADTVVCSSSGWAHGAWVEGRKIVYCHTPARWLYQADRYVEGHALARLFLGAMRAHLIRWDHRAAATADQYLANSTAVRARIRQLYGVDAEVVHPPRSLDPEGEQRPVTGVSPGFLLSVSRLLPYKNVGAVIQAFARLPEACLVVAGEGPEAARLRGLSTRNVVFTGPVDDATLRWLYANCAGVVSASYEDFGLTPIEAAAFGKPAAVLRWGGFRDTLLEGQTGVFFDSPLVEDVCEAILELQRGRWQADVLRAHADRFSETAFVERLREIADGASVRPGERVPVGR
jgi:glycosyltransferase involved in cell wall biosynthesis